MVNPNSMYICRQFLRMLFDRRKKLLSGELNGTSELRTVLSFFRAKNNKIGLAEKLTFSKLGQVSHGKKQIQANLLHKISLSACGIKVRKNELLRETPR